MSRQSPSSDGSVRDISEASSRGVSDVTRAVMVKHGAKPRRVADRARDPFRAIGKPIPLGVAQPVLRTDTAGACGTVWITGVVVGQHDERIRSGSAGEQRRRTHRQLDAGVQGRRIGESTGTNPPTSDRLHRPTSADNAAGAVGMKPQSPSSVPAKPAADISLNTSETGSPWGRGLKLEDAP